MVDALELTARQAKVLELRMGGYGYDAIATYLGIHKQSVKNVLLGKSIEGSTNNNEKEIDGRR